MMTNTPISRIEARIRRSGFIVLAALVLELAGMAWKHPLSFAIVHLLALTLFTIATALYLLSLLPDDPSD